MLRADSTRKATPEEESFDKDVGCIEGGDGERDDVVESSKRADVDETKNHAEDGGDKDCEDRDGGCWVDLSTKLQYDFSRIGNRCGDGKLTLLMWRQNGRPRSRAKDQISREEVASAAIAPNWVMKIIMAAIAEAPPLDPVAV